MVAGSNVKVNFATLLLKLHGHDAHYSFCPITLNFTCMLWMMRRETLLILGHPGTGQLCNSACKTFWARSRPQFLPDHYQFACKLFMMRGETLFILGHRVNCRGQIWHQRGDATFCVVLFYLWRHWRRMMYKPYEQMKTCKNDF